LTEYRAEGGAVIAPEIGNGFEVGLQVPQQPDRLDIAVGLRLQASAGPNPVEITVELEQISRRIAGAPSLLRLNTTEPCGREIKPIDKRLDEP
jgi:hypothetical protein